MIENNLFVGITNYNKKDYLRKCLDSLKYYDFHIVDDCSTDGSEKILKEYNFPHTLLNENVGASAARNLLIEKCNKKYCVFLDGDDYFVDHENLNSILNGDDVYAFPYYVRIERWDKTFKVNNNKKNYFRQLSSVIVKTEILSKIKFDTSLKNKEDLIWIKNLYENYTFSYIDRRYYVYNKNKSGKRINNSNDFS